MKRLFGIVISGALGVMLLQAPLRAQSRTVSGEMKVVTGTVEKIDLTARILTIKTATDYEEITVPEGVKNFSKVTVGDKLTLRYYDNVVLILKKPGEAAVDRRTENSHAGHRRDVRHVGQAADDHRNDHRDRRAGADGEFQGAAWRDVHVAGQGSSGAVDGESRRPGGDHVDGCRSRDPRARRQLT
jgi:hypothetical protein